MVVVVGELDGAGGTAAEDHAVAGARVVLWGKDGRAVAQSARRIRGRAAARTGRHAAVMPIDVIGVDPADPETVIAAWNAVAQRWGEPEELVVVAAGPHTDPAVGAYGAITVTRHGARRFRVAGRGVITVIALDPGTCPDGTAAALHAHLREMAGDLASHGVDVVTETAEASARCSGSAALPGTPGLRAGV